MPVKYSSQNDLLLNKLMSFYRNDNNIDKMLDVINGKSNISLRIIDWFVTNYAKKLFTVIPIEKHGRKIRFKVYKEYKLMLGSYYKRRFDPFCRWDRIVIPYDDFNPLVIDEIEDDFLEDDVNKDEDGMENGEIVDAEEGESSDEDECEDDDTDIKTTIGQLNFFKWAIENHILNYIEENYTQIDNDMNNRNSTAKNKSSATTGNKKTRKKREELSVSATKSIKKENVEIVVKFH